MTYVQFSSIVAVCFRAMGHSQGLGTQKIMHKKSRLVDKKLKINSY